MPSGALTGPIKIVSNGVAVSTATSFTVTTAGGPTITSFSPASGPVGTLVIIKGTGFTSPVSVVFAGNVAAVHSSNATQINADVPSGAVTGKIKIVTNAGTVLTATNFTVTVAPPVITTGAPATVNKAFSYQIVARGSPTSYAVYGLPAGLSVNASTGLISGTPTTAGTYALTLVAVNGGGTGTAGLNIVVASGSF